MVHNPVQELSSLTRRQLLRGAVSGAAGLLAWHQGHGCTWLWHRRADPAGQMTWAMHVTIAPTWFDPAETPGVITPYMFLYAIHDALVKPMPGNLMAPSLATGGARARTA